MPTRTAENIDKARVSITRRLSAIGPSGAERFGPPDFFILIALAVVTLSVYMQVIGHQFVTFDDDSYIKENPMVNRGVTLGGIAWAFTTFHTANWHPLTWIAHMVDSQIFGLYAGGHLFVNALIHVINTLLVFWLLSQATRARWPSAVVAMLFALHPLHVESVAWASERKDTLSTLFGLLSLITYVRYAKTGSTRAYMWSAITLALGLLAKPMLVTWPFVMLLLDYWPLRRLSQSTSWRGFFLSLASLLREKLPLFGLVTMSAVITTVAQSRGGAVRTFDDFPMGMRFANALVSYAKYLLLTFWPHDLAVCYPFARSGVPTWQVVSAASLLIGITAFCLFQRKIRPYLFVGWLWFLGTLVPTIGLVQVGWQAMADRYFYIPSIGFFLAVVFGLADFAKTRRIPPPLSAALTGGVILALATLTNAQIRLWSDSFTLFNHALAVTQFNLPVEQGLGLAYGKSGRYDEAAEHFQKALHIRPAFYDGLLNLGIMRFKQGRLPEAIECCEAAIHSRPAAPKAYIQLAHALWMQNRDKAAFEQVRRALQLAPSDADVRADFGLALERVGSIPEAVEQFQEALRLNPYNAEAHNNLGLALLALGNTRDSIAEFEAAVRLKPDLKVAVDNLRRARAQLNSQR